MMAHPKMPPSPDIMVLGPNGDITTGKIGGAGAANISIKTRPDKQSRQGGKWPQSYRGHSRGAVPGEAAIRQLTQGAGCR